jgi:hypothetical protein
MIQSSASSLKPIHSGREARRTTAYSSANTKPAYHLSVDQKTGSQRILIDFLQQQINQLMLLSDQ